jgi:FKBP-type peptidyl-prolyl cis-trans isomerase FkpA
MRKQLFLFIFIFLCKMANAQTNDGYTMGEGGMAYKIIADGKGDLIKVGDYMELHFSSILSKSGKDSILSSTREMGAPQIVPLDSVQLPPAYFKIFIKLKSGDSLSTKTLVDDLFKKQPETMPPFIQIGDYIYTNIRVTNIYKTKAEAETATKENLAKAEETAKVKADALAIVDDNILKEFISKNNIVAVKSPKGSYVQIIKEGTGAKLNNKQFVKINYTGKTLDGRMFDSNTDSSKGHVEPLSVNLTDDMSLGGGVIAGMSDALLMMNKGTKAIMYIPSGMAYGPRGAGGEIPPNSNLIFEVEVLATQTIAQVKIENARRQKEMMALQKKYQDSVSKADKPVTLGKKRNTKLPIKKNVPIKQSAIKKTAKKK